MNRLPRQLLRLLAVAGTLAFGSLSIAGCTTTTHSSRVSADSTPTGSNYLERCPSSSSVSRVIHVTVVQSRKVQGPELDCNYEASHGPGVQMAFTYSGLSSASNLSRALAPLIGRQNLTSIRGVGSAAYEYPTPGGEISVVAIAHGYTISLLASGLTPPVVAGVAKIAVAAWKH
jgi:hypothetical protein